MSVNKDKERYENCNHLELVTDVGELISTNLIEFPWIEVIDKENVSPPVTCTISEKYIIDNFIVNGARSSKRHHCNHNSSNNDNRHYEV